MEIANMLFEFFGFDMISSAATLPELIAWICKIGVGLFIVVFVIRSIFISIRLPGMRL